MSEPRKCPRIFVSHRRVDGAVAESIAYIACKSNFEYWLDIHDPNLLKLGKKAHLTEMQRKWLTAGIIEMALINCTHVLTVMTTNASGSDWIPYEYGRITDIPMKISRAGSWLDPVYFKANIPDYMLLGIITQSESEIKNWLSEEMLSWKSTYGLSENMCCCKWGNLCRQNYQIPIIVSKK